MRHAVLWMVVLAGLPGVAHADGDAPGAIDPAASVEAELLVSPALDLRLDARELPAPALPPGQPAIEAAPSDHYGSAVPPTDDRGLSFGVEVQAHGAADRRALAAQPDEPGLQDDIERLIEHSTLGLRGTYRF